MTHMSNYANDRLAPFAFLELIKFVQLNTNLQLKYAPTTAAAISSPGQPNEPSLGPMKLADYYFSLYPLEREPLWTVSWLLFWSLLVIISIGLLILTYYLLI